MNREQFVEYLALFGSDINKWPEKIREQALSLHRESEELKGLVEKEMQFESIMNDRSVDDPTSDFERRITLSAKPRSEVTVKESFFSSIFSLVSVPKPALTMTLLLLFGFSVGFFFDSYAYSDENTLELNEYITFDEGEYYE